MEKQKQSQIEEWVGLYADPLYAYAFAKLRQEEVAKDLVQDTLLSALEHQRQFKGHSAVKTWLMAILRNKIYDYYRYQLKKGTLSLDAADGYRAQQRAEEQFLPNGHWTEEAASLGFDSSSPHLLDDLAFKQVLHSCMDALPAVWRFIITSKYLSEKSAAEICQDCQITQSNYWQILHRSKLLLRLCLDKNWFQQL